MHSLRVRPVLGRALVERAAAYVSICRMGACALCRATCVYIQFLHRHKRCLGEQAILAVAQGWREGRTEKSIHFDATALFPLSLSSPDE